MIQPLIDVCLYVCISTWLKYFRFREHSKALEIMAEALLEKETLNYDDVEALLGPPPFGKKHLVSPVDYENQLKKQGEFGKETQSI